MLLQANELTRQASGVFTKQGHGSIEYSDGVDSEHYLADVLTAAQDVSSTSAELERKIRDWPSEYHLSSKRANLLRGLDLPGGIDVLELGCGCGAITRYLGEQGFRVDAVEGSKVRAELAALRCRGLENVNIVCANFNELDIPADSYDVVVLVGVIEYAGRFWPGHAAEEDAVVHLLSSIKSSLRKDGVVIVAIENRTGLKYVLGAHEDHYGQRYVGIHGYPEAAGIKTYTQNEWSTLMSRSGIVAAKYIFPFPDYKLPTVLLSEEYTLSNPDGYVHLEGIASRDYRQMLDLGAHEPMFWQSASANGTYGAFANSFLILMGDSPAVLDEIADIDFVHLPSFNRNRKYCVITRKNADSGIVRRERIGSEDESPFSGLTQHLRNESFIEGNLLSVDWSRSLLIDPRGSKFESYLVQYYHYLEKQQTLNIDLVPGNIIVSSTGEYRHFDQEWEVEYVFDSGYIFFRALMLFALHYKLALREFARRELLHTVRDFILYGFRVLGREGLPRMLGTDAMARVREYSAQELVFQNQVNETDTSGTLEDLLALRFDQPDTVNPVYAKMYWKQGAQEEYIEERSVTVEAVPEREVARLTFEFPAEAVNVSHLRFDPCDERIMDDIGFMRIPYLGIEVMADGVRKNILELKGNEEVAKAATLSGIVFNKAAYGEVFAVMGDNPELEYSLGELCSAGPYSVCRVQVECSHIRSPEYRLVKDRYLAREEILHNELSEQKMELSKLILDLKLELSNQKLELSNQKLITARREQEIREIKSSKFWKATQRYRSLRNRIGG